MGLTSVKVRGFQKIGIRYVLITSFYFILFYVLSLGSSGRFKSEIRQGKSHCTPPGEF